MLTCCPACRTCFRITEAQLAMAQGKVRCGKCKTVFNARQHLQPVPGQSPSESSTATQPAPTPPAGTFPKAAEPAPPGPEPSDTDTAVSDASADTAPPASSAGRFDATTAIPPETEQTPPPSASGQDRPVEPEAEAEAEPDTVEIPMPGLDEMATGPGNEAEPESTAPDSRYKYNDFSDEIFSQQELDDILAEMDQQLSRGIDSPGPELSDPLAMPEGPTSPTDETHDELGEAIDTLFADLRHEEALEDGQPEVDDAAKATPEHAADPTVRDEVPLPDTSQREQPGQEAPAASGTDDDAVPLRLRDSLAIQPPKQRSWLATLGGSLLILLLLVVLAGQLILFRPLDVYRLLPQSKPYIEQLCQQLPCQFNARRDPTQIRLINRDVRAHPEQPDTLLITAALVNQADYQQAYPDLRVTLFDLSGNRVAQRRFTPSEYLGSGYSPFMLMEPGTPLHIKLEVVDPGSDAVNFEFDFQ